MNPKTTVTTITEGERVQYDVEEEEREPVVLVGGMSEKALEILKANPASALPALTRETVGKRKARGFRNPLTDRE